MLNTISFNIKIIVLIILGGCFVHSTYGQFNRIAHKFDSMYCKYFTSDSLIETRINKYNQDYNLVESHMRFLSSQNTILYRDLFYYKSENQISHIIYNVNINNDSNWIEYSRDSFFYNADNLIDKIISYQVLSGGVLQQIQIKYYFYSTKQLTDSLIYVRDPLYRNNDVKEIYTYLSDTSFKFNLYTKIHQDKNWNFRYSVHQINNLSHSPVLRSTSYYEDTVLLESQIDSYLINDKNLYDSSKHLTLKNKKELIDKKCNYFYNLTQNSIKINEDNIIDFNFINGILTVNITTIYKLFLFSMDGRKIYESRNSIDSNNSIPINLINLPGFYIIQLITQNQTISKKFYINQ